MRLSLSHQACARKCVCGLKVETVLREFRLKTTESGFPNTHNRASSRCSKSLITNTKAPVSAWPLCAKLLSGWEAMLVLNLKQIAEAAFGLNCASPPKLRMYERNSTSDIGCRR